MNECFPFYLLGYNVAGCCNSWIRLLCTYLINALSFYVAEMPPNKLVFIMVRMQSSIPSILSNSHLLCLFFFVGKINNCKWNKNTIYWNEEKNGRKKKSWRKMKVVYKCDTKKWDRESHIFILMYFCVTLIFSTVAICTRSVVLHYNIDTYETNFVKTRSYRFKCE